MQLAAIFERMSPISSEQNRAASRATNYRGTAALPRPVKAPAFVAEQLASRDDRAGWAASYRDERRRPRPGVGMAWARTRAVRSRR